MSHKKNAQYSNGRKLEKMHPLADLFIDKLSTDFCGIRLKFRSRNMCGKGL